MADDTTSSPDTTGSPDPSAPEPADLAADQAAEAAGEQAVELPLNAVPAQPAPAAAAGTTAVTAPPEPSVATTLVVEPSPAPLATQSGPPADGEGGEWELLLEKLRQWFNQGELQSLWSQARKPVTLLAALVGLLLVVRVYSAVLGALDSIPLVPGLLELVGVVWSVRYGLPKLVRSSERERLLSGLSNRWKAFRGKA